MSPHLIHDVIPLILDSNHHWWPRDLARLCRVSSVWVHESRKRLYSYPQVNSFHAIQQLALTLQNSAVLRSLVQGVHLRVQSDGSVLAPESMSALLYILGLELKTLVLGGELAVQAERFLNMVTHPESIQRLSIRGDSFGCEGCGYFTSSLEWDDVLSHKFGHLRTLELGQLELSIMTTGPPVRCHLSELALDQVDAVDGDLGHLLDVRQSSLKRLSIVTCVPELYDSFVQSLLPTLSSLRYELNDHASSSSIFDDSTTSLPSLHQVELSGMKLDPPFLSTMARTCPNLSSLSVTGRQVQVEPDQWTDFISRSCLESLRIPFGTFCPPFKPWTDEEIKGVLDVCMARRLEVL